MSHLWKDFDMLREISKMLTKEDHKRIAHLRKQAVYRKEKKKLADDEDKLLLEPEKPLDPFGPPRESHFSCRPLTNKRVKEVLAAHQNRDALDSQADTQRTNLRMLTCGSAAFKVDMGRTTRTNVELRTPPSTSAVKHDASLQLAPKKMSLEARGFHEPQLRFPLSVAFSGVSTAERDELSNAEASVLWRVFNSAGDRLPDVIISGDAAFTSLVLLGITRYIPILKTAFLHKLIKDSAVPPLHDFEVERFPSLKQRFARKDIQLSLNNLKLEIDVFPGSFSHPIIGGTGLSLVLKSIGAEVVRSRRTADFIISDKSNPFTKSTVYKKVDIEWVIESILHSCIVPVEKYFF